MTKALGGRRGRVEPGERQPPPSKVEVVWIPPAQVATKPALRFDHGPSEPSTVQPAEMLDRDPDVLVPTKERWSRARESAAPAFETLVPEALAVDFRNDRNRAAGVEPGPITMPPSPRDAVATTSVGVCRRCGNPVGAGPFCSSCGSEWAKPIALPSRTTVILVTAILGLWGAFPAHSATNDSFAAGQPTQRYWVAFVVTFTIEWVIAVLVIWSLLPR